MCCFPELLKHQLGEIRGKAWAESTMATRRYQWKKYHDFCDRVNIRLFPMDCDNISLFMVHLFRMGHAYTTINNELSALVVYAKIIRETIDIRGDYGIQLTLVALQRIFGETTCMNFIQKN